MHQMPGIVSTKVTKKTVVQWLT